jgi:hypothetical protein
VANGIVAAADVGPFLKKMALLPRKWPNTSGCKPTDSLEVTPTAGLS